MAARALADRCQYHALSVCRAQRLDEVDVVHRAGAAAIAFEQQRLSATGHQCLDLRGTDAGVQRQYRDLCRPLWQQCRWAIFACFGLAFARRLGKGVEGIAAQLADPRAVQQHAVEEQLHALHLTGLQRAHGAEQVGPGIAALASRGQHGAGEQHRYLKIE